MAAIWLLPALLLAGGARWFRDRASRQADTRYAAEHPAGEHGIARGAESFTMRGQNGRALLLLHGSGDTPQTLRYLATRLQAAGYSVHAPLLAGHGRSPAEFSRVRATDYLQSAAEGLDLLRREFSWIGVIGLSMGGALAAQLAADSSDVRALVLLAPYLEPPALVRWVSRSSWLWGVMVPFVGARGTRSVHDPLAGKESHAYGMFSPRALRALVRSAEAGRRALPRVTVETLVVHSREDIRIPVAIAERATATLRAPAERHWVSGCGHVITVDYCKDTVADLVLAFLTRVGGPPLS